MVLAALALLFGVGMAKHTPNPCVKLVAKVQEVEKFVQPCTTAVGLFTYVQGGRFTDLTYFNDLYRACSDFNPLSRVWPASSVPIQQKNFASYVWNWDAALHVYFGLSTCLYHYLYSCNYHPYIASGNAYGYDAGEAYGRMSNVCHALWKGGD